MCGTYRVEAESDEVVNPVVRREIPVPSFMSCAETKCEQAKSVVSETHRGTNIQPE